MADAVNATVAEANVQNMWTGARAEEEEERERYLIQFHAHYGFAAAPENRAQADLIRCIFGNPFRPITIDPTWLTPTVLTLAKTMYDTRDFSAMPILADALEDAYCRDAAILMHCRGGGLHARGCFCVDAILGKT